MDGNVKKGGVSKLIKMIQVKYPTVNTAKAHVYVEKAREINGGSLTGLQMGDILNLLKGVMEEGHTEEKEMHDKIKKSGKTGSLCFRVFLYKWTCRRHMEKVHGKSFAPEADISKQTLEKTKASTHKCPVFDKM